MKLLIETFFLFNYIIKRKFAKFRDFTGFLDSRIIPKYLMIFKNQSRLASLIETEKSPNLALQNAITFENLIF